MLLPKSLPPAARFAFFYGATFLASGVQLPFWPVWLRSRGLSPEEIGLLLAVGIWIKIATNPLAGLMADRTSRRGLMAGLALMSLGAYLLLLPPHGFPATLVLATTATACASAIGPLGESMTLRASQTGGLDYGRIRLWGSLSFIVATLGSGYILVASTADAILGLIAGASVLTVIACLAMPGESGTRKPRTRDGWRRLVAPRHLLFLAAAMLIQASHSLYYAFGTLYWTSLGFSSSTIAWLWVEGVLAEIVLFFYGARLVRRVGPLRLLALGGMGGMLRWAATAFVEDLRLLAVLQLLHALSFAAAHLGAMHHLTRTIPVEQAATGQTLYTAVVFGLGFGLTTLVSGALYAGFGGEAYLAMAALAGTGGGLALLLREGGRDRPGIKC